MSTPTFCTAGVGSLWTSCDVMFASKENALCPLWCSTRAEDDPAQAQKVWLQGRFYVLPPFPLMPWLLLDSSGSPQLWFPEMVHLAIVDLWSIPTVDWALSQARRKIRAPLLLGQPLMAWLLTGVM